MSDDSKTLVFGLGFIGTLLFLLFCNVYQPNAAIAVLTLSTIFMSLIWVMVVEICFLLLILLIGILLTS